MNDYAIASSGDRGKDEDYLSKFRQREERIRTGCCPNGCGGMIEVDSHNAECPACGFAYFSAAGLNLQPGTCN